MINIVKNFYVNNNYSIRDISNIFKISKSTIHRWINKTNMTKNIVNCNIINEIINKLVKENPFITLKMMQTKIRETIHKNISISGVYIHVQKLKLTYKKVSNKMYSNMKNLCAITKYFKKRIKRIKLNDIICLDESYIQTNMSGNYGWGKKGTKIERYIKSNPKKISIMMAITNKKIISSKLYDVNINKTIFHNYLKDDLLPKIKNKYILMDNVSFHRSKEIINLIKESNNVPLFIPPYSPDFNPIEGIFHILKHKIRQKNELINKKTIEETIKDITHNFQKMYKHSFRK